ncbi:Beta-elim-lyase domain-containing protein [Fusarium sp. Ph1]|nr:Beta-elim-lyase domain-containing protein [Fusarium sp. Ph1]
MPSEVATTAFRYSFTDDYSEGAHPALLKALIASNESQETGYGRDTYCDLARQRIRFHLGRDDVGVFFVPSGTSANAISIAACLRPHEAVIAASSGHIVTRETGAVEASGHKIINVEPRNGKLTPESIERALEDNWHFPHMAKPRLVYISNATEFGTIYTRRELAAIKLVCEERGLILFLDGARIGAALTSKSNDMTLQDIMELTDIFWIGGTKNGALLGEAVVVKDAQLATDFEFYVKQHGSLLAKGRIIGAQFAELFKENLYFDLARGANLAAERLSRGISKAGYSVHAVTETNQVFAVLPLGLIKMLQKHFTFYVWEKWGDDEAIIRLLTTWATDSTQGEKSIRDVADVNADILSLVNPVLQQLSQLRKELPSDIGSQLIHGDLTGNVLFDENNPTAPPGIIDITPYWRPALFAEAIVVADGLAWHGQSEDFVEMYGTDEVHSQLLVRALYWRCLTFAIDSDEAWVRENWPRTDYGRAADIVQKIMGK